MFRSLTMKDIATALGLSTSTVSRALNGSYEIGAETKKLVQDYAKSVNYRPNPIALSLKEQKSHSIGVVVCEVANNYFSQAINGIESIAYDKDYHVIITQTHESAEREVVNVQHLLSRHVDGLLVSLSAQTTDLAPYKYLQDNGFPIVFFDRVTDEMASHQITTDNFKGAFEATEYLINAGHTQIGMLANSENLMISRERARGYKAALEKHGIAFDAEYLKACEHGGMSVEEVEVAIKQLLELDNPPNALLSASDRITTSCLVVLNKLGVKIPDDMAVIGFTNSDVAELFDPPLSVVRQPAFQMGQMATEMLIKIIESKRPIEEFAHEQLSTELIIRSSSNKLQLK